MTTNPTNFNNIVLTRHNLDRWLKMMQDLAVVNRRRGDRDAAELLELMADSVKACAHDDWHDASGRSIESYDFQWRLTPLPGGQVDFEVRLVPERAANAA